MLGRKLGLYLVLVLLKPNSKGASQMQESIYMCKFFEQKWSRIEAADVLLRHSRKGGEGARLKLSHPGTASRAFARAGAEMVEYPCPAV